MLIACDGSSFKNGDPKTPIGWAWAREDGAWMSNSMVGGSNNRAELHAVLSVLAMNQTGELTVLMDSQYALNAVEKWCYSWARNGWKRKDGEPIANVDLIKRILHFRLKRKDPVTFTWVKAHQKDSPELNVRADELAGAAMRRAKESTSDELTMNYLDSKNRTTLRIEEKLFMSLYGEENNG